MVRTKQTAREYGRSGALRAAIGSDNDDDAPVPLPTSERLSTLPNTTGVAGTKEKSSGKNNVAAKKRKKNQVYIAGAAIGAGLHESP